MHLYGVDGLLSLLRCVTAILVSWSLVSVIVAVPVAALFRAQARADRIWRELERRKLWHEAVG